MQTTSNILLIRPTNFVFNTETQTSNAFQVKVKDSDYAIHHAAISEFEAFANTLAIKGVNVFIFDDTVYPKKPDAIFPNNWVTFHADGTVILYPMQARNRQSERRIDIIDALRKAFLVDNIIDLSKYESENRFLEGTGSIIFDHSHKIGYACLSPRTDEGLFNEVCHSLHYKPICFNAHDKAGREIYHTNVMMCIGDKFAAICLASITDKRQMELVVNSLNETEHQVIDISFEQMKSFAGNMLEMKTGNNDSSIVALSQTAFDMLHLNQRIMMERYCELVPLSINTIETVGGGSARCMMAEIFLPPLIKG